MWNFLVHPVSLAIKIFLDWNAYGGTILLSMEEERRGLKECVEELKSVIDFFSRERNPEERLDQQIFVSLIAV